MLELECWSCIAGVEVLEFECSIMGVSVGVGSWNGGIGVGMLELK